VSEQDIAKCTLQVIDFELQALEAEVNSTLTTLGEGNRSDRLSWLTCAPIFGGCHDEQRVDNGFCRCDQCSRAGALAGRMSDDHTFIDAHGNEVRGREDIIERGE
jgi:hypothetical protein